jgi:hypothetical protein
MPSGFQQDNNQLSPAYFRVVIDMDNGGAAWYNQSDETSVTTTGRITTWAWDNATSPSRLPQTQVIADALARGNMRFQAIVDMLGMFADCQILDIENSGNDYAANQVDQDTIAFTVKYDRNEFLLPAFVSYAKANYTNSTSGTFTLDGVIYDRYWSDSDEEFYIYEEEHVIKELVYLAVARSNYSKSVRVFQPVEGSDPMTGEGTQRVLEVDPPASTNAKIFNNITVTPIDGTTTTQIFD